MNPAPQMHPGSQNSAWDISHSSPLAPIGTWAMPSCQWVLIIEDWPNCIAAGNGITYGTSGASNQLLSGRGNGDLIKSMGAPMHPSLAPCTTMQIQRAIPAEQQTWNPIEVSLFYFSLFKLYWNFIDKNFNDNFNDKRENYYKCSQWSSIIASTSSSACEPGNHLGNGSLKSQPDNGWCHFRGLRFLAHAGQCKSLQENGRPRACRANWTLNIDMVHRVLPHFAYFCRARV